MPAASDNANQSANNAKWFATTRWSVVLQLQTLDPERSAAALEKLFETYGQALYMFTRRSGASPHDAEDLVQSFWIQCCQKHYLESADVNRGRFRSFLLVTFKRFLANQHRASRAQKRGGTASIVPLDAMAAEARYALEARDTNSPDRLFERRWALALLEKVLKRLEQEFTEKGNSELFQAIKGSLSAASSEARPASTYSDLAAQLGMSVEAIKVAIHRARRRYRALLEEEIANTVASPEEIQEERRYLLSVLSR